jgi:type VII secretion protein EccB
MQTRRDQLQAYRYLLRRVLAAMLGSEPEAIEQPMRRVTTSTFAGIMVGVLACAGVALYGWIADTSASKWKSEPNALIVDKSTNAAYLYLPKADLAGGGAGASQGQGERPPAQVPGAAGPVDDADMVLVQVLNYTSARLILGDEPKIVRVSSSSLDGIARGPRIGIPLAPNAVPGTEHLASSPWSICSTSNTVDDTTNVRVDVLIGTEEREIGAEPIGERAVLVSAGGDSPTYLVWNGKRLEADADALNSVGLSSSEVLQVGTAWLAALEAGQPLRAPEIPNSGDEGPATATGRQTTVGEVFHTTVPDSHYVMLAEGFAPITQVQANLLFGENAAISDGQVQESPTEIGIGEVNDTGSEAPSLKVPDLPASTPELFDLASVEGAPVCLWYEGGAGHLTSGGRIPEGPTSGSDDAAGGDAASGSTQTGAEADRVVLPPGRAALVGERPGPGIKPESFFLITEPGVKFPIPNADALKRLGYADVTPAEIPGSLLRLVPQGPALTVDAAYRAATFETAPAAAESN